MRAGFSAGVGVGLGVGRRGGLGGWRCGAPVLARGFGVVRGAVRSFSFGVHTFLLTLSVTSPKIKCDGGFCSTRARSEALLRVGRAARRGRTQARWCAARSACIATCLLTPPSLASHAPCPAWSSLAPLRAARAGTRAVIAPGAGADRVPARRVLRAAGSRPSPRGGGGCPGARVRDEGGRRSQCAGRPPRLWRAGARPRGALSSAGRTDAARGPARACVRFIERAQACGGARARGAEGNRCGRSCVFGAVVHALGATRAAGFRCARGGGASELASSRRVAASRANRPVGDPGATASLISPSGGPAAPLPPSFARGPEAITCDARSTTFRPWLGESEDCMKHAPRTDA